MCQALVILKLQLEEEEEEGFEEVHCDPGVVVEEELLQLRDNVQTVEEYIIGST